MTIKQRQVYDTHIHLDLYDEDVRMQIMNELERSYIPGLLTVSMHLESSKRNLELSRTYRQRVFPAFGYHPEQALPSEESEYVLFQWIKEHADEAAAIGEIGLPYYMRTERSKLGQPFDVEPYVEFLDRFVEFAAQLNKPVVLHAVYDDADIALEILRRHHIEKAHFHWFKGSKLSIQAMIKQRYMISITPDIAYESDIQALAREYPLELMMVETDGPWPFEGPYQKRFTHPNMIHDVIFAIAQAKQLPTDHVYETIAHNTRSFYGM